MNTPVVCPVCKQAGWCKSSSGKNLSNRPHRTRVKAHWLWLRSLPTVTKHVPT